MSDRIITFVRTQKYDLNFDDWFEHIEADFEKKLTKEQALKKWEAMCNECGNNEQEIDDDWALDFDDMEEKLNEIEEQVEEKVECFACGDEMDADGHRTYLLPCGYFCKGCMEDKHGECYKCFPSDEEDKDAPKCKTEGCENPCAKHGIDPKVCVGKYWGTCAKCIKDSENDDE
jgi:hypothetical protein